MLSGAVFLDRDGTIAKDVGYCRHPKDFELLPRVAEAIRLLNRRGIKVIVVTNQSGIGRGYFTKDDLVLIHAKMGGELAKGGAFVDDIYYCSHHPDDECSCRKPKPTMVLIAATQNKIDLGKSFVVGDSPIDVALGKAAGCRTILVGNGSVFDADFTVSNLMEAAILIMGEMS